MVTVLKEGDEITITRLGKKDGCFQVRDLGVFGVAEDGTLVRPIIAEVTKFYEEHRDGSLRFDAIALKGNAFFGTIVGAIEGEEVFDLQNREKNLDEMVGPVEVQGLVPPDGRERIGLKAGDPVFFSHAFIRPYLMSVS